MSEGHVPVLVAEVLAALALRPGAYYVDGTLGCGGHARAILETTNCRVLGIDRDPDAVARARPLVARYAGRLTLVHGRFSEMELLLRRTGETGSDGILLDLGVSSFQLDEPARGFSFRADGPLDMRMERVGPSAADFVNSADQKTLAHIIATLGEERYAGRVAGAIVAARPLRSAAELADLVAKALGPGAARQAIHPATRTFQALRLHVNDELGELQRGLAAAERLLRPKGRLAVVSFHSLEDRIVKRFLVARSGRAPTASRHAPERTPTHPATFRLVSARPRTPSQAEMARNPRSRSARLRAAERTSVPVAA